MKKNGFTLAELLLTIAIVGVVALLIAPAITSIMPNQSKMRVIKYNAMINDAIDELMNADAIYFPTGVCEGLECTGQPQEEPYNDDAKYSGNEKFKNLMADKLELDDNNALPDGSVWTIDSNNREPWIISIDINGATGTGQSFNDGNTNPDVYKFSIDKYGNVTGDDALTQVYLANPTDMHNKQDDLDAAREKLQNNQNQD